MGSSSIYPVTPFPTAVACTINCYDKPPIFCPDNPIPFLAVLGDSQAGSGNTLRVSTYDMNDNWNIVADSPPLSEQPSQASLVYSLDYNGPGTRLAATHRMDGGISVWNTLDWTNLNVTDLPQYGDGDNVIPRYGEFKPDDSQFLVSFTDQQAGPPFTWYQLYDIVGDVWTLATGMDLLFQGDGSHPGGAAVSYQTAYSPDGRFVAVPFSGGNAEFRVYDASDYAKIFDLQAQPDSNASTNIGFGAWGVAWHPSLPSRYVAFTGQPTSGNGADGVSLYEVNQSDINNTWPLLNKGASFVPIAVNQQCYRCAFSPDGKYFAFGSADPPYLYVYDVTNMADWQPITLPATPDAFINDISWDKNSEWLLACKPSGSVPHAYAYEVNNGWALNSNNDLIQANLLWYCGEIPDQS